jgi:hypothetical protein
MIYQATHHINFAQGEMATFSTFIAWALINEAGWPYWAAFFFTVAVSFAGGLLVQRIVLKPIEKAPVLTNVIVFIGLLLIFNALSGMFFDHTIKAFDSPFPKDSALGGKYFSAHQLGSAGVLMVVLVALFAFFRYTRWAWRCGPRRRTPIRPAGGHPRELDAGPGLGAGRRDRRHRRHDGGAHRLPRPQHDGRHPAVRLCRRAAGRHRQPAGAVLGGWWWACSRTCSAPT